MTTPETIAARPSRDYSTSRLTARKPPGGRAAGVAGGATGPAGQPCGDPPLATLAALVPADTEHSKSRIGRGLLATTALAALVGCGVLAFAPPASAQLPTGGTVVGGQATITSGPGQVTVNQTTGRGIIDWKSFSIGAGNRVDFQQPGASSVTLNRVTGPDPSVIAGQLTANGQIVLVNGSGVFFANGAQVNVGSLVASTANISNPQRFMAGGQVAFDVPSPNANAAVVNAGSITVRDGGLVGLVGHSASNSGVINARLGRVTIGGAETFTVDLAGDGLINFQLGQPVTRQPRDGQGNKVALASNTGTINADGGVVQMTARAAGGVVDSVVNVGGAIRAQAVHQDGGVLILDGGDGGTVNVTGNIDVSGKAPGQRGGQVIATARGGKVNVAPGAVIDSSGVMRGGKVNIGGSYQGKGPVANARDVTVAPGAKIAANATGQGDGGTVIVWSDNATVFGGTIEARGGSQGGNGGFVEVSSKGYLDYRGVADLRAPAGTTGTLLLDPSEIEIRNVAPPGDTTSSGTDPVTIVGNGGVSVLSVAVLEAALATANVIVDADAGPVNGVAVGLITVFDPFVIPSGRTLTLTAQGGVNINAAITTPGSANLTITGFNIINAAGGTISLGSGTLTLSAVNTINLSAAAVSAGAVNFTVNGGSISLTNVGNAIAAVSGTAGDTVDVRSATDMAIVGSGVTAGTFVTLVSGGQVVVSANVTSNNISGGGVTITSTGALGAAGILQTAGTISGPTVLLDGGSGDIVQTGGNIVTTVPSGSLTANAGGTVQLVSPTNDVNFVAGSAGTNFRYVDADDVSLGIGTVIPVGAGTIAIVTGITIGPGGYVDIAANQIAFTTAVGTLTGPVTALIGTLTGAASPTDNPDGVVVLRPTTAGTAMVVGGTGTGLNQADLLTAVRVGTLRIGSIGRAAGLTLGGTATAAESAAGLITVQGLDFSIGGTALRTLILESGAAGQAIVQTGPITIPFSTGAGLATAVRGGGTVELTLTNSVPALAHVGRESDTTLVTQSGTFRYVDNSSIPVVSVAGSGTPLVGQRDSGPATPGVPANTAILTSGGNVTLVSLDGDIQFINALVAANATVRLNAAFEIFQQAAGGVVANSLLAIAGDSIDLATASTLNNVLNFAASGGGSVRLINASTIVVPGGGVAGDSLVPTVVGVRAGVDVTEGAPTLELAIASGDIVVNGPLSAPAGLVVLRRIAGAVGSEIILNGTSFDVGSGLPYLVVLDLTGSATLSPPGFGALISSSTPASGTSPIAQGPNPDGTIVLNNVNAGDTTMYLVGGAGSSISGSGTFGLLGVYVPHTNPIALFGSVRAIDPTTPRPVFGTFSEPFDSSTFAGFYVRRTGGVVQVQTFNTCPIASGICSSPHVDIPPVVDWWPDDATVPIGPAPVIRIDVAQDQGPPTPLSLSTIIVVNQGNEYFFNADEEQRQRRAARGGQ